MKGGKHQVTRERCADGDFRRLQVAYLTDENYVGVLSQYGPQL